MKQMSQNELSNLFHELLSFLMNYDEKWIRFYFADELEFFCFLSDDEDLRLLTGHNAQNEICSLIVLCENAILTAVFSPDAENEDAYTAALSDMEALLKAQHYTGIYYGEGYYSYGVFSGETENPFGAFLKKNGFAVESVFYDIHHTASDTVEEHVDQLKAQKITTAFDVCGRYESLYKRL